MFPDQDRWRRLTTFDLHAKAFRAHGRQSTKMGEIIAETDIGRLCLLAGRVARALAAWRREITRLDLGRAAPVPPALAGRLISESLFDEALTPLAYRVFDAALDLALDGRASRARRSSGAPPGF